ncbi:MAG: cysteine dioxygenase family protein [Acidobacteriota bacterium]
MPSTPNPSSSAAPADTALPGCRTLIDALDHATAGVSDHTQITRAVQRALETVIGAGDVQLPATLCEPCDGHYARHLIHRASDGRYSALAMVWGAGQATPVHDHNDLWCVEGVVQGTIDITAYDLLAHEDNRYRFQRGDTVRAGVGSAGRLIPPFDYHTIGNSQTHTAITIHVYGGDMNRCNIFRPETADHDAPQIAPTAWYRRESRVLSLH